MDPRTSSGKFLRVEKRYPESFRFLGLCHVHPLPPLQEEAWPCAVGQRRGGRQTALLKSFSFSLGQWWWSNENDEIQQIRPSREWPCTKMTLKHGLAWCCSAQVHCPASSVLPSNVSRSLDCPVNWTITFFQHIMSDLSSQMAAFVKCQQCMTVQDVFMIG